MACPCTLALKISLCLELGSISSREERASWGGTELRGADRASASQVTNLSGGCCHPVAATQDKSPVAPMSGLATVLSGCHQVDSQHLGWSFPLMPNWKNSIPCAGNPAFLFFQFPTPHVSKAPQATLTCSTDPSWLLLGASAGHLALDLWGLMLVLSCLSQSGFPAGAVWSQAPPFLAG